ncbi:MAG: glycosyltransferase family 2 protein [Rhizobacter sp.]|nr:glycosyltransferase family 2 protein [Bacteriovorax sp.]
MTKLSIIIPTKDSPASLLNLLESVSLQNFSDSLEVIVVHNLRSSFDGKKYDQFQNSFKAFHYICSDQLGVNTARNVGMIAAAGEIIWFLDDDCYLQKNNLAELIYEKHLMFPEVAGIGGSYLLPKKKNNVFTCSYHQIAEQWLINSTDSKGNQICLIGGNASYKSKEIKHIYDEYITFGGSEISFNSKFIKNQKILLLDREIDIEHRSNVTLLKFTRKAFHQGRGHFHNHQLGMVQKNVNDKQNVDSRLKSFSEKYIYEIYRFFFFLGIFHRSNKKHRKTLYVKSFFQALHATVIKNLIGNVGIKAYWVIAKPVYNISSQLWKIKKPYYWMKKWFWKTFSGPLNNIWKIKKLLYFFKLNIWKIKKPVYFAFLNLWKVKKPFHFVALNFWKVKKPFHFVALNFWKIKKPFHFVASNFWKIKKPFHFLALNFWKIKKPFHFLALNFWKIKKPFHFLALNFWKIKTPYYFISRNLWKIKLPFYKLYYVLIYHVKTYLLLGFLHKKTSKTIKPD